MLAYFIDSGKVRLNTLVPTSADLNNLNGISSQVLNNLLV